MFLWWYQIMFNLLSDVPMWRLSPFIVAFFSSYTPSGVVSGCEWLLAIKGLFLGEMKDLIPI